MGFMGKDLVLKSDLDKIYYYAGQLSIGSFIIIWGSYFFLRLLGG